MAYKPKRACFIWVKSGVIITTEHLSGLVLLCFIFCVHGSHSVFASLSSGKKNCYFFLQYAVWMN